MYHNAIYRVDPGPNLRGCLVWLIAFGLPFGLVTSVLGFDWGVVLLFGFAIAVAWLIWAMLFREELLVVVNVGVYPTSVPGVSRVVLAVGRDIGQPTRTNPKYEKYW